jgi:arylsulfatase A-like enzyme
VSQLGSDNRTILPLPEATPVAPSAVDVREQDRLFAAVGDAGAPPGAPNVVVVLVDDMGFGASSAFGGPCEMLTAERLAADGLRYTRFHTTAICSSTRAALLTGRNHHAVGYAHVVELATNAPGYHTRRPASAATIARILALNGYATGAFGKMHQTPVSEVTPVGPYDRWPTGEGFQRFYGFVGAMVNQWVPTLHDGTTPVENVPTPEEGYHLSEDLVDKALDWIRDVRTVSPDKPFFAYVPFGACHSPFHVGREWAEKYRGRFDHGWDEQRQQTFERQKELGVVPDDAELAPWSPVVPRWDEIDAEGREASCRLMELYAGFAEHMDAQVGRLVDGLTELGELDNTLFIYILGDNGASAEGGLEGRVNEFAGYNGVPDTAANVLAHADVLGSPETWPMYSAGWAMAMDTPYQWYKQVASHYGGTRNGLIVHWPARIRAGGSVRHQWHHVIDIAPSILEAAGLPQPVVVDGVTQMPIHGTAMNYSFDEPAAPERHLTQYFEMAGSRGIYHDGWVACTPHRPAPWDLLTPIPPLREDVWELYDTRSDWTQARDIAAAEPQKLEQLKELFLIEAARNNVLPLDDRPLAVRRQEASSASVPNSMTFHAGTRRVPQFVMPQVTNSSHVVSARVQVPDGGAQGVICAHGGRFGGWALYCIEGILTYCHNMGAQPLGYVRAREPLPSGEHEVRFEFDYDGGGLGKGGTGTLVVDGRDVGHGRIERTTAFLFTMLEGFDVGTDLYTPVTDEYAAGDNAFNGSVLWVRIDAAPGVAAPPGERERVELAIQ